ncbi:MAG: AsmA-like C-terminal domain-containing protein [Pseudomonadota bacterium]
MKNILKMAGKRTFFYAIALLLVLIVSFPLLINELINTQIIKRKISTAIFQKTGASIESSKLSIIAFPQPSIEIKDFNTNINPSYTLSITQLRLNIDPAQLIHRRFQVGTVIIEHPEIKPLFSKTNTSMPFVYSMPLIEMGSVSKQIFSFLPNHQSSIDIVFKNLASPYFQKMDGSLILSRKTQDIDLTYTIHQFKFPVHDLAFSGIQNHLTASQLQIKTIQSTLKLKSSGMIEGKCNLNNVRIFGLEDTLLFDSNSIQAIVELSNDNQLVSILPFDVISPKANLGIVFSNNINTHESKIEFNGSDIHVGKARQMALALFKNNKTVLSLFDILHDGLAPFIRVSFAGNSLNTLFNEHHLKLSGSVKNGQVKIPQTNFMVSHITADTTLIKGVLDIQAKTGLIQGSDIKKGALSIDLLNYKDYPFKGEFALDLDLSKIPQTLIDLLPDTRLAQELSLVDQISGRAFATLGLVMDTGSDHPTVFVKTKPFSTTGLYARIPGKIDINTLNFTYDSDMVTLGNLSGTFQNSSLADINARIDLNNTFNMNIESGSGHLDLSHLMPWLLSYQKLRQAVFPVKKASGTLNFSNLSLSGPVLKPEQWTYKIIGDCQNINATTQTEHEQIKNLSCNYQLSNGHSKINNIQASLASLPAMEPILSQNFTDSIKLPIHIRHAEFSHKPGITILNGDLEFNNSTSVQIDLAGNSPNQLRLNRIQLKNKSTSNAEIKPIYKQKTTLFDFKGRLNTQTIDNLFKPDSYVTKKIHGFIQNQPLVIYSDQENALNIQIRHIDLNPLLPFTDSLNSDPLYLPNHVLQVKADQIKIKKLTYTDTMARISLTKDHSYIRLNQTFLCNLKTSGYINFKDDLFFFNLPFEAQSTHDVQDLFTCLMDNEKFMDGQYSLTGNLSSSSAKKDFLNTIEGKLAFSASDGRIYKLTLLSRILSVLNVSNIFKGHIPDLQQKGFSYKLITIDADIKDSKIYLKKAVIDGTDMTMIFHGWIDPVNDQLDLTCLVAPFKTIDLIVKYIPIVNTLLDGRLVSVPVKANGKLSDPQVTPLHPSAVGNGLINMMSDVLKTPVRLWDKLINSDE